MPLRILFVCTGNIFRSPMAQAYLGKIAADRGLDISVGSAGTLEGEREMSPHALAVIARDGVDMTGHRSRLADAEVVSDFDLVLCMAREHVREIVLADPRAWARTFTLKELVRRGETAGPRREGQELSEWLELVGRDRRREDLLGWSAEDDVADPIGGTEEDFRETGRVILDLVNRLVDLLEPPP